MWWETWTSTWRPEQDTGSLFPHSASSSYEAECLSEIRAGLVTCILHQLSPAPAPAWVTGVSWLAIYLSCRDLNSLFMFVQRACIISLAYSLMKTISQTLPRNGALPNSLIHHELSWITHYGIYSISSSFQKITSIYFSVCVHAMAHVWRSEDNWVLSSHHVALRIKLSSSVLTAISLALQLFLQCRKIPMILKTMMQKNKNPEKDSCKTIF